MRRSVLNPVCSRDGRSQRATGIFDLARLLGFVFLVEATYQHLKKERIFKWIKLYPFKMDKIKVDKNLRQAPLENWKMWTCWLLLELEHAGGGLECSDYMAEHTSAVAVLPVHYLFMFPVSPQRAPEPLLHRISHLGHGTVIPPSRPEKC